MATYNWDIGTIERGTDNPKKFEVPSHQWVDLTDRSGAYGATVLTDCKNGSDKPDDNTLRLTLIRTPGTRGQYDDQSTQDLGHHEFVYGLAGHAGDWRKGQTDWQAYRLNQPLIAFEASKHAGALGKTFSLLSVSHSRVRVLALKKAEQSDETIVRLVELDGKPAPNVQIAFAAPITAAREVNGAEEPVGAATVANGKLVTSFTAFQPRTFAVKLGAAPAKVAAVHSQPVKLAYDLAAASNDGTRSVGGFAADGRALPAEMLLAELSFGGVKFDLAPARTGTPDAVVAKGQTIQLPAGKFNRVYVLAASADGDQKVIFRVGGKAVDAMIQDWGGFIGQWDDRIWKSKEVPIPARAGAPARTRTDPYGEMVGLKPGFIKRADVAWFASHRHTAGGANEPYAYSYLFLGKEVEGPDFGWGRAYVRSSDPVTKRKIFEAVSRTFYPFGVRGKDEAEFIRNAATWYGKNRDRLSINYGYQDGMTEADVGIRFAFHSWAKERKEAKVIGAIFREAAFCLGTWRRNGPYRPGRYPGEGTVRQATAIWPPCANCPALPPSWPTPASRFCKPPINRLPAIRRLPCRGTYAHVLWNAGYGDAAELQVLTEGLGQPLRPGPAGP